jgi:DNA invertase Pin-like site-specific DNA recombinase
MVGMDSKPAPTGTGALIGYARVSTADQDVVAQIDRLTAAGCTRIFPETASGALCERPQLDACLDYLRPGDVLVVVKLDQLGRSLGHLIETVQSLDTRGVGFRSLTEKIDTTTTTTTTTTAAGRLLMHILGALAEFERALIVERTRAGLAAARARGRTGGRPPAMTPEKVEAAQALIVAGRTVRQAAEAVGDGRSTLYRHLGEEQTAATARTAS